MKNLILIFLISLVASSASEANNYWTAIEESTIPQNGERQIVPRTYQTYELDFQTLKNQLLSAALEHSAEAKSSKVIVKLPMADGSFERFRILESPILHVELAEKWSFIKTFSAIGLDNPRSKGRIDFTPRGFHGMIFSENGTVFIDPYSTGTTEHYIAYYKKDFQKNGAIPACGFEPGVHDQNAILKQGIDVVNTSGLKSAAASIDCTVRTYDLALACTGEYATFHGGTVAGAAAAMATTMNRVNGVFLTEASIFMMLVANNNNLIFLNGGTDPYSNNNGGAMLGENQTECDNTIGSGNYDIGHVFSTGGGGVAFLGAPCDNGIKAGGVTGLGAPVGDPFDIDYVAHEMGHQYGGNHTFNNACGGNRNNGTAYEPGSATTIQGYAGICPPDIQNNSDPYYHSVSLIEFSNFVTGAGNTCPTPNNTSNNIPAADAGANYTIPISTPFFLDGSGSTDPDGDPLTYCWEQWDNGISTQSPVATSTTGPNFRSLDPSPSPIRYFPNLNWLLGNNPPAWPTWEVIPSVTRTTDFILSVRDNILSGGCNDQDITSISWDANTGPFTVLNPNTFVTWQTGTPETVSWDVAGTDAGNVNCANVDILLSTDGGLTYPFTLATSVPNNGSATVVASNVTSTAIVMVVCSDNIFFDISNEVFEIIQGGCTTTADCNDNDPCTVDDCINQNCVFTPINCDDGDPCTNDVCNNGLCSNTPFATPTLEVLGITSPIGDCDAVLNLSGSAPSSMAEIIVILNGDDFSDDEQSIEVYDAMGNLVGATPAPIGASVENATDQFVYPVNTADGPFTVEIFDTWGDGMMALECGFSFQDGSYSIEDGQGNILVADNPFESQDPNGDGDFCSEDGPISEVNANLSPVGPGSNLGNFSGTGIDNGTADDGLATFDPAVAGPGSWVITYTYTDPATNCDYTLDNTIVVTSCGCLTNADCDDNDACTTDVCNGDGTCSNTPIDCDDNDACTTDTCDPTLGCVNTAIDCNDNDACTTDTCDPNSGCVNTAIDCNDNDDCTTDSCDPNSGCVNTAIDCNDNDVCTTDTCDPNSGCVNTAIDCDDNDACTADACDPIAGCVSTAITCDDGEICTDDSCDITSGCVFTPDVTNDPSCQCTIDADCDDSDVCTTDTCDPVNGCIYTSIDCNDNDACTTDSCDPVTGCIATAIDCDDSDACTTDTCDPATGCVYTGVDCSDPDPCVIGSCDPVIGCIFLVVDCVPSDMCTTVECDGMGGCISTPIDCDDNDACTDDVCDPLTGCVTVPILCDDNDACTDDLCDPLTGCFTVPTNCGDPTPCSTISCDPAIGCIGTTIDCDDGDACTDDDCDLNIGCVNLAIDCDDGDACTDDSCNPLIGCEYLVVDCFGDACFTASCDPQTGCEFTPVDCDDNDACTNDDCDLNSGCVYALVNCDDNDACTLDNCDPITGCVFTAVNCDDGDACNGIETCDPILGCVSGQALVCDDGDICTEDLCDPATGCVFNDIVPCAVPSLSITDPCNCIGGGLFEETVTISTTPLLAGLNFTVSSITGGIGINVGDVLTDNGDGTYDISFQHADAIGYYIEVTDGTNTQAASNVCLYPDPQIGTLAFYCDNDVNVYDVSPLISDQTGNSGSASSIQIDGLFTSTFNPSVLGPGVFTISFDWTGNDDGNGGSALDAYAGDAPGNQATNPAFPGCQSSPTFSINIVDCTTCDPGGAILQFGN